MENTSSRVARVVAAKQKELTRRGSDNAEKHSTNGVGKQVSTPTRALPAAKRGFHNFPPKG